jgi:hypothetical protein
MSRVSRITAKEDTTKLKGLEEQVRALQKINETLEESLRQSRNAKFKLPVQGKNKTSKGSYVRFFFPDSHGSKIDPAALGALLRDLEYLNPRELFMMGDHLDCDGFLAQHHVWGVVADCDYTYEDDIANCNGTLDAVQKVCPKGDIKYLEGNHEERIAKWCITAALRSKADAGLLLRSIGAESVLNLAKRGIPYISKAKFYDGCRVQGTLRAGKCFVTHGTRHGKDAAKSMLSRFGASVVFAHVHKLLAYSDRTVHNGEMGAWSVGHIAQQQPAWRHGDPTDWSQGYAFQIVQTNGEFLHVNVPIIDGKSLLPDLGKVLT